MSYLEFLCVRNLPKDLWIFCISSYYPNTNLKFLSTSSKYWLSSTLVVKYLNFFNMYFLNFWQHWVPSSFCVFSFSVLKLAISQRNPNFLYWIIALESKCGVWIFLLPFQWINLAKNMYVNIVCITITHFLLVWEILIFYHVFYYFLFPCFSVICLCQ